MVVYVGAYIIAINPRQQGNPILKHLKNVPHQFVENIVPDFGKSIKLGC